MKACITQHRNSKIKIIKIIKDVQDVQDVVRGPKGLQPGDPFGISRQM